MSLGPKWANILESEAPSLSILFPLVKWETIIFLFSMSRIIIELRIKVTQAIRPTASRYWESLAKGFAICLLAAAGE